MMLGMMMQYCNLYTNKEKEKFLDDILAQWDEESELHQAFVNFETIYNNSNVSFKYSSSDPYFLLSSIMMIFRC